MNVLALLQKKLQDALTGLVADPAPYAVMLKPAQDARFGDYQANCAMPLAKQLGKKPPELHKRSWTVCNARTCWTCRRLRGRGSSI